MKDNEMPDKAGNPSTVKLWLYGLTADEWLHVASEGDESEVAPCCANISNLREMLRAIAGDQDSIGLLSVYVQELHETYRVCLESHELTAEMFPILHKILERSGYKE